MSRKVILCAVSTLSPTAKEAEYTYEKDNGGRKYPATQTNEAPVKCLIDRFGPIDRVLCLTTPEVLVSEGKPQSDWAFFREKIAGFCREQKLSCPVMEQIDYRMENAAASVAPLLEQLADEDEIYLDVTGGGRDAIFLMSLMTQLLQYKSIRLGAAIYGDFKQHQLRRWENEFALFDLLKGVEDFVSYGKAGKLCRYFDRQEQAGHRVPKPLKRLCNYADRFSRILLSAAPGSWKKRWRASRNRWATPFGLGRPGRTPPPMCSFSSA